MKGCNLEIGRSSEPGFSNIFWQLSSSLSDERDCAATAIVSQVLSETDQKELKIDQSQQAEDAEPKTRLQYTVKRLFKGLAGQKPESKIGFSLALTLLLEKLSKSQIRSAFASGEKCLLDMKVDTKQEASCKRIGACLLLIAATRSGAFAKIRSEQRTRLLDTVASFLGDRSLADLVACVLAGAIEQLPSDEFNSNLFEKLSEKLSIGWDSLDANGLLLLLCCHQHQKEAVSRSFIKSHYATKHLVSEANFDHFLRICLSTVEESRETLSACRLHPVAERLLDCLLAKSTNLLSEFVTKVAIATVANVEMPATRKALGLACLAWVANCPVERFVGSSETSESADDAAAAAKAECLSNCLTNESVCQQLHSHASNNNSLLHEFACSLLSNQLLPSSVSEQPILIAVTKRLLGSDCLFDYGLPAQCRIMRADRMGRLPVELLDDCASRIESELSNLSADSSSPKQRHRLAFGLQTLRQLVAGSRALLSSKPKSCSKILLCLAELFLLPASSSPSSSDVSVAKDARSAFCRALDSVSSAALSGGSPFRRGYRRCLRHLARGLIDRLASIGASESSAASRALTLGLELLRPGSAGGGDDDADGGPCGGIDWCFSLAYLHLGFHLLPGAAASAPAKSISPAGGKNTDTNEAVLDEASAQSLIDDLSECHRRSAAGDGDNAADAGGQPRWPDVLLDGFVGLLFGSRSRLLRSVASLVARQVASLVTLEGVAALNQLLLEGDGAEAADESGDEDEDESGSDDQPGEAEDEESEISISGASDLDDDAEDGAAVDPDFRRACKSALGEAACPSDAEADMDPSDLSDSAMERVDQALSLAFRSQLGPNRRSERAAALERRRHRCQAKLRLLDVAEALLLGAAPDCRASLAAGLAQLALLAVGGGGGSSGSVNGVTAGNFWSAAPAGERDQLRQRSLALLKRAASAAATTNSSAAIGKEADESVARAVDAALAANLKSPLPAKMAETAADILSALLRIRPSAVESRLASALSRQLSPSPSPTSRTHRFRLGGLALWQRVCSERPQVMDAELRKRLLDLFVADQSGSDGQPLKPHDLAALASLAGCLVKRGVVDQKFHSRLARWTFARLDAETSAEGGVSSAHLLAALLQLSAALLRRARQVAAGETLQPVSVPPGLAERLRAIRAGTRSRDLRRGLQACLAELASVKSDGDAESVERNSSGGNKKRAARTSATKTGSAKKRRRLGAEDPAELESKMETD